MDAANKDGGTPLQHAARWGRDEAGPTLVVAEGAAVDAANKDGGTPLQHAARCEGAEALTVLVAAGAVVDAADKDGETPLQRVAPCGRAEAMTALVAAGAALDAVDKAGRTPLHYAACLDEGLDVATALFGADSARGHVLGTAHTFDLLCRTAVYAAVLRCRVTLLALLLEHLSLGAMFCQRCGARLLGMATALGDEKTLALLVPGLRHDGPPDDAVWQVDAGFIVHIADRHGHVDLINNEYLRENWSRPEEHMDRPLHIAAQHGHVTMVEALLDLSDVKEHIDAKNRDKHTPLSLALGPWREARAGNEGLPASLHSSNAAAGDGQAA